jgi:peptide deformylase
MLLLPLVYAPNAAFKKIAKSVEVVDDEIRVLADQMLATMYSEKAIGLGANMVGILKRIIVVDLQEDGICNPYIFINPEITYYSEELQTFTEGSVCFPGIKAEIIRPKSIKLKYLDKSGKNQEIEASGFFATVIQHELDYLNGKVFLDYLSKFKRDTLLKKMQKHRKSY